MGEAKRRAAALDAGKPWPRRRVCPVRKCRSPRVVDVPADDPHAVEYAGFWGNRNPCPLRICRDCFAVWEPWPDDASEDCVERAHTHGPCSNCAYRAGSSEMEDPVERERLLQIARDVVDMKLDEGELVIPTQFCCHKGIPIKIDLASDEKISFDYEAAGVDPRDQSCTGFLRAVWAERKRRGWKGPGS